MSITEIETAITQLPGSEIDEVLNWLEGYRAGKWDTEIEDDLHKGRLDRVLTEVEQEYVARKSTRL